MNASRLDPVTQCSRCLRAHSRARAAAPHAFSNRASRARFHSISPLHRDTDADTFAVNSKDAAAKVDEEQGAMSRLLSQMTEESLEQGGSAAQRSVHDAGFSEDLKAQLEARLAESNFRSENAAAFSVVNMPV